MGIAALLFFIMQNNGSLVGGPIAMVKLLWLFYAIFFWFVLPFLIILDGRSSLKLRTLYKLFLLNMCVRAVIELYMMYFSINWHPYYGIGHDIFSIFLIFYLALISKPVTVIDRLLVHNLWLLCAMFMLETGFAWYMLGNTTSVQGPIYFVPDNGQHAAIMLITWGAVLALSFYLYVFTKKWLYAPP